MLAALATALIAAIPIPSTGSAPAFIGTPATPKPLHAPPVPQHPHMAPNGSSLLHEDAWQSDASRRAGPLGDDMSVTSTLYTRDCGSVTFDSRGRIVTVCVGLDRPVAKILDPHTLDEIATLDLPPRDLTTGGNPLTSFGGGGYFYLADDDTAMVPTTTRHVYALHAGETGFEQTADIDFSGVVKQGDSIISALPDWSGRLWVASRKGVFGTEAGTVQLEPIGNSFAIGENGVYVVTDAALYKFVAAADGTPVQRWRVEYPNIGTVKPGQTQAGSGTTPTLMARNLIAITDNADPMNVRVYTRTGREVCHAPVFEAGASNTDQSLIAVGRSLVAENNYGYSGPAAVELGATTTPGIARVDISRDLERCSVRWTSQEIAPSVVPKVSIPNGLLYTYTKPAGDSGDPWYFTAIDFRTGDTIFKRLAGQGLGYNNNYAPVTIGPDGTAYVGTLGGLVALADATPPPQPEGVERPRLRVNCRGRVVGRDTDWVTRAKVGRRVARIRLTDGRVVRRRVPRCAT